MLLSLIDFSFTKRRFKVTELTHFACSSCIYSSVYIFKSFISKYGFLRFCTKLQNSVDNITHDLPNITIS